MESLSRRMGDPIDQLQLPPEAKNALLILRRRIGPSLTSIYLHGSAVAGGLRERSDVDLLAFVSDPLPASVRAPLLADLMAVSGHYPFDTMGRRPLEIIIMRSSDLQRMRYPARAEFVYGEWLRTAFEGGAVPQPEASPEFTLLLAHARRDAVALIGPNITDLVPDTPQDVIRRAIGDLLPELIETAEVDEHNVLLTLARMWRTLATGEFVSKNAAADWAGPQLSDQAARTLARARDSYLAESSCHGDTSGVPTPGGTEASDTISEIVGRILPMLEPRP